MLKDILHLTKSQAAYFEQKVVMHVLETSVSVQIITSNRGMNVERGPGMNLWTGPPLWAGAASTLVLSTSREVGNDLQSLSDLLQPQTTLNPEEPNCGSEISQEFIDVRSHHQWNEYEIVTSHTWKLLNVRVSVLENWFMSITNVKKFLDKSLTLRQCELLRQSFSLQHKRVHTGKKLYDCNDC